LDEAQARGELTGWTLDFDDTIDTDGNTWQVVPEFSCRVGDSLYQVLDKLSGSWIDVAAGDVSANDADSGVKVINVSADAVVGNELDIALLAVPNK